MGMKITKKLIAFLTEYEGFEIVLRLHEEVPEEELKKREYKFPTDSFTLKYELDDIGYGEKIIQFGCEKEGD